MATVTASGDQRTRLLAHLVDGPEAPLKVGSPVRKVFEDAAEGFAIPHFKLAGV